MEIFQLERLPPDDFQSSAALVDAADLNSLSRSLITQPMSYVTTSPISLNIAVPFGLRHIISSFLLRKIRIFSRCPLMRHSNPIGITLVTLFISFRYLLYLIDIL